MATMSVFTLDMVLREMQVNWKITVDTKTKQKKKNSSVDYQHSHFQNSNLKTHLSAPNPRGVSPGDILFLTVSLLHF